MTETLKWNQNGARSACKWHEKSPNLESPHKKTPTVGKYYIIGAKHN